MKPAIIRSSLRVLVCLFLTGAVAPLACSAESYTLSSLGLDQGYSLYGLDGSGAVVVDDMTNAGGVNCGGAADCYFTYAGGGVSLSAQPPDASLFDNGTACTPTVAAGFHMFGAVCNGSLLAMSGYALGTDYHATGVYNGPDPATDFVAPGGDGTMFLNASGDIAFDDVFTDRIYEAVPQTPEPSSFLLLGTGLMGIAGVTRKRLGSRS